MHNSTVRTGRKVNTIVVLVRRASKKKKKNDETTKAINAINPALVVCSCHFTFITLSTDSSDLFRSESCFRNEWFQIKTNTTVINYPTVEHNVIMFVFNILKNFKMHKYVLYYHDVYLKVIW